MNNFRKPGTAPRDGSLVIIKIKGTKDPMTARVKVPERTPRDRKAWIVIEDRSAGGILWAYDDEYLAGWRPL